MQSCDFINAYLSIQHSLQIYIKTNGKEFR